MIALLCPTRGRPKQFLRMLESVGKTAINKTIFLACSNGGDEYVEKQFPIDCPTVFMWNKLAEVAMQNPKNKLFMLAADDIIFETPGWDNALIEHYNKLENKIHVYALQDSRDVNGTPHPIVTREYIDAMGYFLPPIFVHWFGDTWTTGIANANGCFTHLERYKLVHDKPSDKGQPDETHNGIRRMGWHERDKYVNDTCQHFLELEKHRLAKAMAA